MAEAGVDVFGVEPEHVGVYLDQPWDLAVTLCDSAQETAEGTDDEKRVVFRHVRDEVCDRLVPEVRARGGLVSGRDAL